MVQKRYKQNEKVYIINKSSGCSLNSVMNRNLYADSQEITYQGEQYTALIGYYYRVKGNNHVVDYHIPAISGDFYNYGDFLSEDELYTDSLLLDDTLFEI